MKDSNNDSLQENFSVRNSLTSIFEQLFFIINLLNQNNKKIANSKSEEVNSKLSKSLNDLIKKLWELSVENNYYWHNCPSKVYEVFYNDHKDYFIKTFGKKRFYSFLENEINSFLSIQKSNNPTERLNFHNNILQDIFILLDYHQYLSEENRLIIKLFDDSKIQFLKNEIEKDGYFVVNYKTYFKIKKEVNRNSSDKVTDNYSEITHSVNHIENVNIFNIDNKAFPLEALNKIMDNFNALTNQNKAFEEYPEQNLNKLGLPKFNVQTRFELLKRLKIIPLIEGIKSPSEKAKTIILGSIMDVSPDNARHLYKNTFKNTFSTKDEDKLKDFLAKESVDL